MALRRRLRRIVFYGLSRGFSDALLGVRALLLATLLGPEAFGGWVLFRLATNYCGFARLGVNAGLEFHVARLRGPEGASAGLQFWRTTLGFVLSIFGGIALIAICASFFVESGRLAMGMRWFAGAIITEQVWLAGLIYLRSKGDLRSYTLYEVTNAALQVAFAILLTPWFGLAGAFASFVLATSVGLILLARSLPIRPAISTARLRQMLNVGLPVVASIVLGFILSSADRLIVAASGDISLLGLYGFAFSVAGVAGSLAWVIRVVVYPDVYADVAQQGKGPALGAHLSQTVLPFATIVPPLLGLLAVIMGPVVSMALPKYIDAIPAARLLLFVGVTAGFERLGALGVVAIRRQKILPLFSGAALVINVTCAVVALRSGLGLQGVAAASVFSNLLFGLATIGILSRLASGIDPVRFLVRVAVPAVWCAAAVVVIGNWRPGLGIPYTAASVGIYLLVISPLIPGSLRTLLKARRLAFGTTDRKFFRLLRGATTSKPSSRHEPATIEVNLRPVAGFLTLPRFIDLRVGDSIRATKADGTVVGIAVASVDVESGAHLCPRTRVNLQVGERAFSVRCGMAARDSGGIGPIEIDGVLVGCEVTRLLFSGMKGGSSPFSTYERLQLRHDLRLALWDLSVGAMPGADGRFVVRQPRWTGNRFANWLHSTGYGIHSAIDIFATPHIPPEEVCSPVDGTVYEVYNRDSSPEDTQRSKAINIYSDAVVGPNGEKVLYRFQHLSEILVSDGEPVGAGQIIGLTGHTGFDPEIGDHLHFEIRLNPSHFGRPFDDDIFSTVPVNPYNFLLEWYDREGRE